MPSFRQRLKSLKIAFGCGEVKKDYYILGGKTSNVAHVTLIGQAEEMQNSYSVLLYDFSRYVMYEHLAYIL